MKRKHGMTLAEHMACGDKLQRARSDLMDALTMIDRCYAKTDRANKAIVALNRDIDLLKSHMDSHMFGDAEVHQFEPDLAAYYGARISSDGRVARPGDKPTASPSTPPALPDK